MRSPAILAVLLGLAAPLSAVASGEQVYAQHCAVCHQPTGEGAPGFAPPLAGALVRHAGSEAGRGYLAQVVVSGMAGPIRVNGVPFVGVMPGFGTLPDADLQAVLAYVLGAFNGVQVPDVVTAGDIASARQRALAPNDVRRLRDHK